MILKEKFPALVRALSLLLLIGTIAMIVTAFIRARRQPRPPGPVRAESILKANVTSVVEGYEYVTTKDGRETMRLLAAKDTGYEDGRHELEKVDLTAFDEKPGKSMRIVAERGFYVRDPGVASFEGNVKVTSSDSLEVSTQSLKYEQLTELASTEVPIQFRQGELSGSSTGAQLNAKTRQLMLLKDAHVVSANPNLIQPKTGNGNSKSPSGPPVDIYSEKASYAELEGVVKFEGNANVIQGEKSARADSITGRINLKTRKLEQVELRGNSLMKSQEKGKASELQSRDIDLFFDETQHLKLAVANGAARGVSLEPDSPREITAEKIEANYQLPGAGGPSEKESVLKSIWTQGRTTMKIEVAEGAPQAKETTERVIEADAVQALFREDGKYLSRAEAAGNALLTITPKQITPTAEKKRLRAANFNAEFYETGNAIKTFLAEGNAIAEFEPLPPVVKQVPEVKKSKDAKDAREPQPRERLKKTLSGKKLTANFQPELQDLAELIVEGEAKFTEGDRQGTATRAVYTAASQIVTLRGKPQLWDLTARGNADEIDANLDTGESFLRGRVRTIYYSREKTGGAAPFKKDKAPVTIASDRAVARHRENAAKYEGNVRAWQDSDFVRSDFMELDQGERVMNAWGNAQSAFYDFEREVEKGRKDVVPVFAQADRIIYNDASRTTHYEGSVKIRQGTDRIDAAVADAWTDEDHKLIRMTAAKDVVITQPARRATGDQLVYTVVDDSAVLTGNQAMVEDRERDAVTKSSKLTLHLRDARIEANDANDKSGGKKRVKTTHRIQN